MTPIQAIKKSNQKLFFSNLRDWRLKQKPKGNLGDLAKSLDIKKISRKAIQQIGVVNYIH